MTERNDLSRYKRRNKRRNNNIQIFLFGGLAAVVFIVLLLFLSSDDKEDDKTANEQETENTEQNVEVEEPTEEVEDKTDKEENEKNDEENEDTEEVAKQDTYADRETYAEEISLQGLTTTDQNVEEAYIADWPAIGTKQTGKHTVTYEDGSDDRNEIKKAISYITELDEDNIIEHWIGNGGDGKVIATISDKEMKNHYKVYLSWVKDEGWKPTKLEYLKSVKTDKDEQEVNKNQAVEVDTEDKTNNEG